MYYDNKIRLKREFISVITKYNHKEIPIVTHVPSAFGSLKMKGKDVGL